MALRRQRRHSRQRRCCRLCVPRQTSLRRSSQRDAFNILINHKFLPLVRQPDSSSAPLSSRTAMQSACASLPPTHGRPGSQSSPPRNGSLITASTAAASIWNITVTTHRLPLTRFLTSSRRFLTWRPASHQRACTRCTLQPLSHVCRWWQLPAPLSAPAARSSKLMV